MFRLTIVAFHGEPKTKIASHTHENPIRIVLPLVILSVLSVWFFYSPNPIDASIGWFHHRVVQPESAVPAAYQWDFLLQDHHGAATVEHTAHQEGHHYLNVLQEETHHFHYMAMFLSLLIAGSGIALAFAIYQYKLISADALEKRFKKLHTFSYNKWYFDELYHATIIAFMLAVSKAMAWFDNYVVDGIVNLSAQFTRFAGYVTGIFDNVVVDGAVNLTASVTGYFGAGLRKMQTGRIQTYLVFALIGLLLIFYFFI